MTDDTITPDLPDRIEPVDLQAEMQRSYLDYAMSVIVSRALPDVRDGLKPVHRRVLYAMYDGGYRPDRNFSKSARVVGDVMGVYHPHGDSAIYDTLVRLTQAWALRYPLVQGQGNFGSPGDDGAAAARYTECRLDPLAMEMVRDIDEDTVDFGPNYDGRTQEPLVLPARFPNLLVNGSAGIAVGMATNIPPHNLREIASGVRWALEHPEATREELSAALAERVPGPDFPTGGLIVGRSGIEDAYRTGRGLVTMRAEVEVTEDARGRTMLVVTQLPYQVNPDSLMRKIKELVNAGKITGLADAIDQSSGVTMRLEIVLSRDAVPRVVLNQLYKHTQLQDTFGCNMVALVDGVPRTLAARGVRPALDPPPGRGHPTTDALPAAQGQRARAHPARLRGALDQLDAVIELIRRSADVDAARAGLITLLDIDELQANAILDLQLRRLAALERQKIIDELADWEQTIADLEAILASETRQRQIIGEELTEIVEKFGDDRRTRIIAAEGDMSMEDLIPQEDVVVSITRGGYVKRTKVDLYRSQRRGGKGVRGAQLRADDVVEHFFVTTTHDWILFFTNKGRVYRAKAYELPETGRDARGQHVANLLAFQPDETIAQVLDLRDYGVAPYLVLATRQGLVKKTRLTEYDSPRTGGVIAINLREDDELISAQLVGDDDDLIMVSRKGQSVRFHAKNESLRPMGRATSGVIGMRFRAGDELLAMDAVRPGADLVTFTDGGFWKRTSLDEWTPKGRGGIGVVAMKLPEHRGVLVGALVVVEGDEVLAMTAGGGVIRTTVTETELQRRGRDTMGVRLIALKDGDAVVGVARNAETEEEDERGRRGRRAGGVGACRRRRRGGCWTCRHRWELWSDGDGEPDGGNDEGTER